MVKASKAEAKNQKAAAAAQSPATSTSGASSNNSVRWPDLPYSGRDLTLETLIPDQVLLLPNAFTSKDCARWVSFLESSLTLEPSPPVPKRGHAVRSNERFSIQDEQFAKVLYQFLAQHLESLASRPAGSKPKALNPNIRVYRYQPGHEFRAHYDDSVRVGPYQTQWTLLLYLSGEEDGVKGGETAFYIEKGKGKGDEAVVAPLNRGTILFHRHGQDCLLHEGRPVGHGGAPKWVLRSDVCF